MNRTRGRSPTPIASEAMGVGERPRVRFINLPRGTDLIDAGKHARHTVVYSVVGRAATHGEQGISAERGFGENALERNACQPLLFKLSFNAMDGVSKKGPASLNVPGVLVLASGTKGDAFACKELPGFIGQNYASFAVRDELAHRSMDGAPRLVDGSDQCVCFLVGDDAGGVPSGAATDGGR